jgi:hypothetical protein
VGCQSKSRFGETTPNPADFTCDGLLVLLSGIGDFKLCEIIKREKIEAE